MNARYSINENNVVSVYYETIRECDTYPDGTPWANVAEAEAWAQAYVAAKNDETLPMPPFTRGGASRPQPTQTQKLLAKQLNTNLAIATTDEEKQAAQEAINAFYNGRS
jgi:hypothetical protein